MGLCLDKGYNDGEACELVDELSFSVHTVRAARRQTRLSRIPAFAPASAGPRNKPANHRAILQLACGLITWRMPTTEAQTE